MMDAAIHHHRRSLRLEGYDYSQNGAYFVTLCTHNRACLFGEYSTGNGNCQYLPGDPITGEQKGVTLNAVAEIASLCWLAIPEHFPFVELDAFVIMPNHVHGVLLIQSHDRLTVREKVGANGYSPLRSGTSGTLSSVIRGFKTGVTKWFRENRPKVKDVWQRNYYEHIIRNDADLREARVYIENNPFRPLAAGRGKDDGLAASRVGDCPWKEER